MPVDKLAEAGFEVVVHPPTSSEPPAQASLVGDDEVRALMPDDADSLIAEIKRATSVEAGQVADDRARDLPEAERKRVHAAFVLRFVPPGSAK